jgi:hypothetical protein
VSTVWHERYNRVQAAACQGHNRPDYFVLPFSVFNENGLRRAPPRSGVYGTSLNTEIAVFLLFSRGSAFPCSSGRFRAWPRPPPIWAIRNLVKYGKGEYLLERISTKLQNAGQTGGLGLGARRVASRNHNLAPARPSPRRGPISRGTTRFGMAGRVGDPTTGSPDLPSPPVDGPLPLVQPGRPLRGSPLCPGNRFCPVETSCDTRGMPVREPSGNRPPAREK